MVASRNRTELLSALLGGLGAGRRVLLASPLSTTAEVAHLVESASVSTFVGDAGTFTKTRGLPVRTYPIESVCLEESSEEVEDRGTGALLLQSSGTTGPSKIVVREMAALDAVGLQLIRALALAPYDRMLVTIPLHHSYGIDCAALAGVIAGCRMELHEVFNPTAVRSALESGSVDVWPAVPVMLDAVSRRAVALKERGLGRVISAGSPLPLPVAQRFRSVFGTWPGQVYGTSEFGSVTCNDPEDAAEKGFDPTCVGLPMQDVTVQVIEAGAPLSGRTMRPGQEGEIVVSARSMMSGYLGGSDPFFRLEGEVGIRTGDTGFLDERGRLHLTGRTKLFIDVGGQKVNPIEVELVLARFPGVREAIVIAMPHMTTADRVKAILLPEEGVTLDVTSIREFVRQHLSPFKVPRRIEIRKELPRSPTGKVLRSALHEAERVAARRSASRWSGSEESDQ
jgi:long-chain acyl-CoA synthetase